MTKIKTGPIKPPAKRNPRARRTATVRAKHLQVITRRYLEGAYQVDIAKELGISTVTVKRDLADLREAWLGSSLRDFDQAKAEQLAKIDLIEASAWERFHESYGENVTLTVAEIESGKYQGTNTKEETKDLLGDPRYLTIAMQCVERRSKILGLDAPEKVARTDSDGNDLPDLRSMCDAEIEERIKELDRKAADAKTTH